MEDRVTYGEMRTWFLGSYYSYCRFKVSSRSPWVEGESEVGYAYSELENSFDLPIERLMLEVLSLILAAGRSSDKVKRYHLGIISELLNQIELPSVLVGLPLDEAREFKNDLKALGIC